MSGSIIPALHTARRALPAVRAAAHAATAARAATRTAATAQLHTMPVTYSADPHTATEFAANRQAPYPVEELTILYAIMPPRVPPAFLHIYAGFQSMTTVTVRVAASPETDRAIQMTATMLSTEAPSEMIPVAHHAAGCEAHTITDAQAEAFIAKMLTSESISPAFKNKLKELGKTPKEQVSTLKKLIKLLPGGPALTDAWEGCWSEGGKPNAKKIEHFMTLLGKITYLTFALAFAVIALAGFSDAIKKAIEKKSQVTGRLHGALGYISPDIREHAFFKFYLVQMNSLLCQLKAMDPMDEALQVFTLEQEIIAGIEAKLPPTLTFDAFLANPSLTLVAAFPKLDTPERRAQYEYLVAAYAQLQLIKTIYEKWDCDDILSVEETLQQPDQFALDHGLILSIQTGGSKTVEQAVNAAYRNTRLLTEASAYTSNLESAKNSDASNPGPILDSTTQQTVSDSKDEQDSSSREYTILQGKIYDSSASTQNHAASLSQRIAAGQCVRKNDPNKDPYGELVSMIGILFAYEEIQATELHSQNIKESAKNLDRPAETQVSTEEIASEAPRM